MDASVSTLVEDLESEAFTGSPEGCVFEMSESSMIVTGGCVKAPARCYYYRYTLSKTESAIKIAGRNARNIGEMCTFSTTLFCHSPHWSEILRLSFHGFSAATFDFYLS